MKAVEKGKSRYGEVCSNRLYMNGYTTLLYFIVVMINGSLQTNAMESAGKLVLHNDIGALLIKLQST